MFKPRRGYTFKEDPQVDQVNSPESYGKNTDKKQRSMNNPEPYGKNIPKKQRSMEGTSCTYSNNRTPASPEMMITDEDPRIFEEEVHGSYGVTSKENEDRKRQRQEGKQLPEEIRIPLNNSHSKMVHISMDPFKYSSQVYEF